MGHYCRNGNVNISENEEGYLFLNWENFFLQREKSMGINFCPICGMIAKKCFLSNTVMDKKEEIKPDQLQPMHKAMRDLFIDVCKIITSEDLDEPSFKYCIDVIENTTIYLKNKNKEKNV